MIFSNYSTTLTVEYIKRARTANYIFIRGRRFGKGVWKSNLFLIHNNFHTKQGWRNLEQNSKYQKEKRRIESAQNNLNFYLQST